MKRILLFILPILIIVALGFTVSGILQVRFTEERLMDDLKRKARSVDESLELSAAFAIKQLLNSPAYARKLGENGREHIRNNFLLTRHLRDYMLLFLSLYHPEDTVYL